MHNSHNAKSKSKKFQIVAGKKPPAELEIRAGGTPPPDNMPAGTYRVICEGAKIASMWGKATAIVEFRVCDGEFFGVALTGFFSIELVGKVTAAGSSYNALCATALNREIRPGDDLHPAQVFPGKIFEIVARFRASAPGKRRQPEDPSVKKDAADKLRVGAVVALVDGM